MKVLFIFHYPLIKGGASKSGITLVKGLQERGIEVMAICPEEGSLAEELRKYGIPFEISRHRWAYPYFEQSITGALKFIPKIFVNQRHNKKVLTRLTELAKKFRPDIIHSNSGVIDIGLKLAENLNIPHISHFREFGWKDCHAVMWHEGLMRSYHLQHGIAIGKEIKKWHMRPGDDITLIYNGIISNTTSSSQSVEKEPYFLYVGGLYMKKGIEDLLQAYALLDKNLRAGHHLKIAGSAVNPHYMDRLLRLSERLGIKDEVEWLGEQSDVNVLMSKATAMVVPSHQEAFGRIVVEAMSNGCLVIGRDTAGIKEQFDNGIDITGEEIGLRFKTTERLATLMQQVVSQDPSTFASMINNALKTVQSLYTTEAYVNNVIRLYHKIIDIQQ